MSGSKDTSKSSNSVATLALISLIPVFIFVIANGWQSILSQFVKISANETLNLAATWTLGVVISVVAVILAWAVASERARIRNDKAARFTWIAYFGVLVVLSALGTMNWLFKELEASTFVKESTENTLKSLTALDQFVGSAIKLTKTDEMKARQEEEKRDLQARLEQLQNYYEAAKAKAGVEPERFRNQILGLFDSFEAEVRNPLKEGCGEVARGYLQEIKTKLPDLRLPSGDCGEANPDVMLKVYREAIDKALENWASANVIPCELPDAWRGNIQKIRDITGIAVAGGDVSCSDVERTLRAVERSTQTHVAEMLPYAPGDQDLAQLKQSSSDALRDQIAKVKALYLDEKQLNKTDASPVLKAAWSEYSTVYTKLGTVVDPAELAKLPVSIDDQRVDKIGNIGNTIEILLSRYDRLSTYPIILAAVLFDMILIAFFFRVEIGRSRERRLSEHEKRLRDIRSSLNEA